MERGLGSGAGRGGGHGSSRVDGCSAPQKCLTSISHSPPTWQLENIFGGILARCSYNPPAHSPLRSSSITRRSSSVDLAFSTIRAIPPFCPIALFMSSTNVGGRSSRSSARIFLVAIASNITAATSAHRSGRKLGVARSKKNVRSIRPSGCSSDAGLCRKPKVRITVGNARDISCAAALACWTAYPIRGGNSGIPSMSSSGSRRGDGRWRG